MNISYIPVDSHVFSIDKNKHELNILVSSTDSSLEGDTCLYDSPDTTVGVSYTFSAKDIELSKNYLEIPILTKNANIIKDVDIRYFLSNDISNLNLTNVYNACSIYKQSLFPEKVSYVLIDINSIISSCKESGYSFITFTCTCGNPMLHDIKVYSSKQNLNNVIIKSELNSNSSTGVDKNYNYIVDKYYNKWVSDIVNSELIVNNTQPYELNFNDSIELNGRAHNEWKKYNVEVATFVINNDVEYNTYGSIVNEETRQASTGYFYTTFLNGRYCVVDPDGYINIIKNILFPMPMHPYRPGGYIGISKYFPEIVEAYNTSEWKNKTYQNIAQCGLNTYEDYCFHLNDSVFTYPELNFISKIPTLDSFTENSGIPTSNKERRAFRSIFMDDAEIKLKKSLQRRVFNNTIQHSNKIIAYIVDSEPQLEKQDLALCLLTTDPMLIFRRNAAKYWVKKHYNIEDCSLSDITEEMNNDFISFEFYVYSKIVTDAIREFDNNHMIFSPAFQCMRFNDSPYVPFSGFLRNNDNFFKVLNKFYDALALTNYSDYDMLCEEFDNLKLNIPIFLNEFSMKSMDQSNFINKTAGPAVKTQQERAKYFEHIALQCIKHKKCIGYTWYQYSDVNQPEERVINRGLVDANNELYPELSYSMKKINSNADKLRKES